MALQVYGIPNCGTCKKAIAWLDRNDVEYEFVNTKETPPTQAQIEAWIAALGAKPMRNTSGQSYRALGEKKDTWDEAAWAKAFAEDAMLLKRPLFVKDSKAIMVGFKDADAVIREKLGL